MEGVHFHPGPNHPAGPPSVFLLTLQDVSVFEIINTRATEILSVSCVSRCIRLWNLSFPASCKTPGIECMNVCRADVWSGTVWFEFPSQVQLCFLILSQELVRSSMTNNHEF